MRIDFFNFFLLSTSVNITKIQINFVNYINAEIQLLKNFSFFILLRFFFKFEQLTDIIGVDNLMKFKEKKRFSVFYSFLNINTPKRFLLELKGNLFDNFLSVFRVFESALWPEREIWDLFGIFFSNHPDLRRLLTDYGFSGFPLRKDFPIIGYLDLIFDQEKEILKYQKLELMQENRNFLYKKIW